MLPCRGFVTWRVTADACLMPRKPAGKSTPAQSSSQHPAPRRPASQKTRSATSHPAAPRVVDLQQSAPEAPSSPPVTDFPSVPALVEPSVVSDFPSPSRQSQDEPASWDDARPLVDHDWPPGLSGTAWTLAAHTLSTLVDTLSLIENAASTQLGPSATPGSRTLAFAAARLNACNWPARPLRLGLCMEPRVARVFADAPAAPGAALFHLPWTLTPGPMIREHSLDAVLSMHGRQLRIITAESTGHEAAWYDWNTPRPLSFPALFSAWIDPAQITLAEVDIDDPQSVSLSVALAQTAALAARCEHRLTSRDRLHGRRPVEGVELSAAFARLASLLAEAEERQTQVHRIAARVVSAYFAALREDVPAAVRRRALETAARIAGDEPEVMLRLAAARIADLDDSSAVDALLRADRMLRDRPTLPGVDHTAFVQAELDARHADSMSLGRVAAGVVLACATLPTDKLVYTREDFLDELRFAEWLVGRDQDRALLIGLTRELVHQRRGERLALPAAPATPTGNAQKAAGDGPVARIVRARRKPPGRRAA